MNVFIGFFFDLLYYIIIFVVLLLVLDKLLENDRCDWYVKGEEMIVDVK